LFRRKVKKEMKEKMTKRKKVKMHQRNKKVLPLLDLVKNHLNANKIKQASQLFFSMRAVVMSISFSLFFVH
jgi:hypothetical protein